MTESNNGGYERIEGVVKFFNEVKGFGFARREKGGDVFIHANELRRSNFDGLPQTGDKLVFDVIPVEGKGGKAANIKRAG